MLSSPGNIFMIIFLMSYVKVLDPRCLRFIIREVQLGDYVYITEFYSSKVGLTVVEELMGCMETVLLL